MGSRGPPLQIQNKFHFPTSFSLSPGIDPATLSMQVFVAIHQAIETSSITLVKHPIKGDECIVINKQAIIWVISSFGFKYSLNRNFLIIHLQQYHLLMRNYYCIFILHEQSNNFYLASHLLLRIRLSVFWRKLDVLSHISQF